MTGIYKIENILDGKYYIGKAKDINVRWQEHIKDLRKNKHCNCHLQYAWNLYGENNFKFSVILECKETELDYYEYEMIEEFEARNPKFGYNMRTGGKGGIANEEVNQKISNTIFSLWQNENYKQHMSNAHIGKHTNNGGGTKKGTHTGFDNCHSQSVVLKDSNLPPFGSKSDCARFLGCSVTAINKAIKQNRKCKGYFIVLCNV